MEPTCQCRGDEQLTSNGLFWCEQHSCWKTQHRHELCQNHEGYRTLWSEGRGPGQTPKEGAVSQKKSKPSAWGDRLHEWLESHGITEERYKLAKQKFGLPPKCNCAARQEWLNRVGAWFAGQETEG